jgi:hypothetical protein
MTDERRHDAVATSGRGWLRRLGWLVAIWAASVLALAVVAYVFRVIMASVGLTR